MGYGLLCGLWVWRRRTHRPPCCFPMSNPSASPWTAWPDGSGRWDNWMAVQRLPRDVVRSSSGFNNSLKRRTGIEWKNNLYRKANGAFYVLLRLKQLGQWKLPIVFPLPGMLCLWPLSSQCASYVLNVSAARQTLAYTTSFPTEVIRGHWDEASVSTIVCSCTSWLRTPALHHGVPHLDHFCFTSPQPVRPKEASDSVSTIRDVMPLTVELAVRFLRTQC